MTQEEAKRKARELCAEQRMKSPEVDFDAVLGEVYEAGYKEGRAMMFPRDAIIGMEVHLPDLYHVKVWRLVEYKDYPVEKDV